MGRKTVKKQQDKLIDDAQIKDRLSEYQKPNSPIKSMLLSNNGYMTLNGKTLNGIVNS